MGFLNRVAEFLSAEPRIQRSMIEQRATAGNAIIPWQVGKAQYLPHEVASYDNEAYRKIALIYGAVQYLADAVGTAPLKAYQSVEGEDQELPDHAIRQLFTRPNAMMGEAQFMGFVTMVMAITGFCVIEKERDRTGNVIGLWPLRSDWIRPIPRQQAAPDWEYRVPGRQDPFILKSSDVIVQKWADTPSGSYTGIGPLEVLLRELDTANAMTDFVKVFMDRGALPLYAIIPQDEGPAAAQWKKQGTKDAFMEAWRNKYGGLRNAAEPLPLVGVKDVKRIGLDFNELAYVDLNKLTEVRIAEAFRIPLVLLHTWMGQEHSTYSNYEQARKQFYEDRMFSLWSRLDDGFSRGLLNDRDFTSDISLMYDTKDVPALQGDENAAVENAVKLFTSGIVSRHAAQRRAGEVEHGPDVFLQSFSLIEIPAEATQATAPKPTATVSDSDDATGSVDDGEDERMAVAVMRRLAPALGAAIKREAAAAEYLGMAMDSRFITRDGRTYVNERALTPEQRAATDRVVTHHRGQIARLASVLEPQLQRFFRGQRDRIVEVALRGGKHILETRAIEQIDWDEENDILRDLFEKWWSDVHEVAFADAAAVTGTQNMWTISNPYLRDLFNVLGYRVQDINETTRKAIEDVVRESLIDGTTIPDLAEQLRDTVEETYRNRHVAIARTESMHGYAFASQQAYQASGVVTQVQVHDNADHTEAYSGAADGLTCSQRNGLVVSVDRGYYHVSSDHPNGTAAISPILSTPLGEV